MLGNYAIFPLCVSKSSVSFTGQMKENTPPLIVTCSFSEYLQQLWSLPRSLTQIFPLFLDYCFSYPNVVCLLSSRVLVA